MHLFCNCINATLLQKRKKYSDLKTAKRKESSKNKLWEFAAMNTRKSLRLTVTDRINECLQIIIIFLVSP